MAAAPGIAWSARIGQMTAAAGDEPNAPFRPGASASAVGVSAAGAAEGPMTEFEMRLAGFAASFEERLAAVLVEDGTAGSSPHPAPDRLLAAMRHGVLGGGKRLRPFLLVETARLVGGPPQGALLAAAAIECLHCYSLVHDDLPAMDDDDLRRGRPSTRPSTRPPRSSPATRSSPSPSRSSLSPPSTGTGRCASSSSASSPSPPVPAAWSAVKSSTSPLSASR